MKLDFIIAFRKYKKISTLDFVVQRKKKLLTGGALDDLYSAADHRRAEIMTEQLYDRVPKSVWRWVK
ncbi:Hha/YmoA family nucleoid-associated regulatory protein [Providencia sp. PROV111]|uniref:Hha/YmoA family nucleoid-associated regulatory protein n=1 Tax=Providencia sp. PROV111 TaxID=2949822 RepID=UPI0023491F7D|nr:Hha/YmoA family nucleoid-associated regulatory protein [Providencia sp. PROV111]